MDAVVDLDTDATFSQNSFYFSLSELSRRLHEFTGNLFDTELIMQAVRR